MMADQKTVKLRIPVAVDDAGFASWRGDNWSNNEKDADLRSSRQALEDCRSRRNDETPDAIVVVEVEIPIPAPIAIKGVPE
jgi:hypothetical protein